MLWLSKDNIALGRFSHDCSVLIVLACEGWAWSMEGCGTRLGGCRPGNKGVSNNIFTQLHSSG